MVTFLFVAICFYADLSCSQGTLCTMQNLMNGSWTACELNSIVNRSQCDTNVGYVEHKNKFVCKWLTNLTISQHFHLGGCEFIRQYDSNIFMIGDSLMGQLYRVPQEKGCRTYRRNNFLTAVAPKNNTTPKLVRFFNVTIPRNVNVVVANSGGHYSWLKAGEGFEKSYEHMLHQLHNFSLTRTSVKFIWLPIPIPSSHFTSHSDWGWSSFHSKNEIAKRILKRFHTISYEHLPTVDVKHDGMHWCQNGPIPKHLMELVNHAAHL